MLLLCIVPVRMLPRRAVAAPAAVVLLACAQHVPPSAPAPADIPQLEAELTRQPSDPDVRLRLAESYRVAGRADDAATLLEPVVEREPPAALLLGLVREDQHRYADARRLYEDYLRRGQDGQLRRQVRDRLTLLSRAELQFAVRDALAREQQLAATPSPQTVGVFPFLLVSEDPDLGPLGTALAELLTTDLAQTDRLTVLERVQVQHLLDELALGASERVEPRTAARSGRILGAGTLVQGRVEGGANELSLQAAVLRVPTDTVVGAPLRDRDALARIIELEKRVALGIYERLGIQLTAAERQRVLQRPTSDVQALIALGYGLEAQDAGRYRDAIAHYTRAIQLDPRFALARARLLEAEALERSTAAGPATLGTLALEELQNVRRLQALGALEQLVVDPSARDAFVEFIGAEGAARQGTARIIFRRPGGQP